MARPRFRQLAHTADARLAVWGDDEEELIRNGIAGALKVALPGLSSGAATRWEEVDGWPDGTNSRLVKAINEALFWLYCRGHVTVDFDATRSPPRIGLVPLPVGYVPGGELKAATFHDLEPSRRAGRLRAILTLDL